MAQHYKNHIRWYPAHHFVFYPVTVILAVIAIVRACNNDDAGQRMLWLFLAAVVFLVAWLSFMLRQHYSLINQNRTVRLEMRFRYYVLTQQRFEPLEEQLSFGQIAALRFASDWELPSLVQKVIREKLSPDQIKQSIVDWLPDLMRV